MINLTVVSFFLFGLLAKSVVFPMLTEFRETGILFRISFLIVSDS